MGRDRPQTDLLTTLMEKIDRLETELKERAVELREMRTQLRSIAHRAGQAYISQHITPGMNNPLGTALGLIQLIESSLLNGKPYDKDSIKGILETVVQEIYRCKYIIDGLMIIIDGETISEIDVAAIIRHISILLHHLTIKYGATLTFSIETDNTMIYANKHEIFYALALVLIETITNGVGKTNVRIDRTGDDIEISITPYAKTVRQALNEYCSCTNIYYREDENTLQLRILNRSDVNDRKCNQCVSDR